MADKSARRDENVQGAWYVDENCIGCGLCAGEAPENFEMGDDDLAYVKKQPSGKEETDACASAMESCPVDAIGDDG